MQDDLDLVRDILDGSMESFDILIGKYEKAVYRFCCNITSNAEASKDITQEVFITVFNKLYTYRQDNRFSSWLFKIAHNKCIDFLRKKSRNRESEMEIADDYASNEISPEQWVEYTETERLVRKFLESLDNTDRQILAMRYAGVCMTFAGIAQVLNMTESSVKKRFYRTRDRFRSLYMIDERR